MRKLTFVMILCLLSAWSMGCSNSDDKGGKDGSKGGGKDNGGFSDFGGGGHSKDSGLPASCFAGPSARTLAGDWTTENTRDGIKYVYDFHFTSNRLDYSLTCSYGVGPRVTAAVSSRMNTTDKSISILDSDERVETIIGKECRATLRPFSMQYTFAGHCLVLTNGGSQLVLTPSN